MNEKLLAAFFLLLGLIVATGPADAAEIFVHDAIAVRGEEIRLTAETRGRYFARGGTVVEFRLGKAVLGRPLSGGDGFAFQSARFFKTGLHSIQVQSGRETARANVLVVRKGGGIVVVDVEGTLFSRPFDRSQIAESRDAVRRVIMRAPVVYLHTGALGKASVKEWLTKNGFPEAPVLDWRAGEFFADIKAKGLLLRVVVGSSAVVESAAAYRPRQAFCFEETEGASIVKSWKEIAKTLK